MNPPPFNRLKDGTRPGGGKNEKTNEHAAAGSGAGRWYAGSSRSTASAWRRKTCRGPRSQTCGSAGRAADVSAYGTAYGGAARRAAEGNTAHALAQRFFATHGNPASRTLGVGEPQRPAATVPPGTRIAP